MSDLTLSLFRTLVRSLLMVVIAGVPARAADLPDGDGRALVEGVCTSCHSSNQLTRSSGYSRDDWKALTATMVNLKAGS